jgi:hypothetical protein
VEQERVDQERSCRSVYMSECYRHFQWVVKQEIDNEKSKNRKTVVPLCERSTLRLG